MLPITSQLRDNLCSTPTCQASIQRFASIDVITSVSCSTIAQPAMVQLVVAGVTMVEVLVFETLLVLAMLLSLHALVVTIPHSDAVHVPLRALVPGVVKDQMALASTLPLLPAASLLPTEPN